MDGKVCTTCGDLKLWVEYYTQGNTGLCSECKDCNKKRKRNYRLLHLDHVRALEAKYQAKTKRSLQYYHQHKKRLNHQAVERTKRRRKLDPLFRLQCSVGSKISACLKGEKAGRKWEQLVGYSIRELKEHLERGFLLGMDWGNYGQWHVDHIIPKSLFNIVSAESAEFKACWALSNLQPLWAFDNISKGGSNRRKRLTL